MENAFEHLRSLVLSERPIPSDVIVWLQGDRYDRGPKSQELYQEGFAPRILISGNDRLIGKGQRTEEDNISLYEMKIWLLDRGVAEEDILLDDQSFNTHDQAVNVLALAVRSNWNTILLVGSPYYQTRAFLTFLKYVHEIGWNGRIINQPAKLGWNEIPGGRNKPSSEYAGMEKQKIERYADHVASIADGLKYYAIKNDGP